MLSTAWQHAMIVNSSDSVKLYIDGVDDTSVFTNNGTTVCNPTGSLHIGARSDVDPDRSLGGSMAEWAKWDRALDTSEIAALAKGFSPLFFPTGLAHYFPMIRSYTDERIVGLSITNVTSVPSAHPPIIYPSNTDPVSVRKAIKLLTTQNAISASFATRTVLEAMLGLAPKNTVTKYVRKVLDELIPYPGAFCWGEATPTNDEIGATWAGWSDGSGGGVSYDSVNGKLQLVPGEVAHGPVEFIGSGNQAETDLTVALNEYGTGSGVPPIYIRGDTSTFAQDAGAPAWEAYTGKVAKTWTYIQVKLGP
jgi:hypothetical protein